MYSNVPINYEGNSLRIETHKGILALKKYSLQLFLECIFKSRGRSRVVDGSFEECKTCLTIPIQSGRHVVCTMLDKCTLTDG